MAVAAYLYRPNAVLRMIGCVVPAELALSFVVMPDSSV